MDGDQHGPEGMLSPDGTHAIMQFSAVLLEYSGLTDWIEPIIESVARTLREGTCPPHASTGFGAKGTGECEHARFLKGVTEITATQNEILKTN